MTEGTYIIVLGTSSGGTDWLCLGTKIKEDGTRVCCVSKYKKEAKGEEWDLVSVPGAAGALGFYLRHRESGLVTRFGDANAILLAKIVPVEREFFIRLEHTGDGWVAINNHDNTLVMDAAGKDPTVGAVVFPNKWNKGNNQRWRFVSTVLFS